MVLLKDSETMITEKIGKQKKETDQIIHILNKIWPLIVKAVQEDHQQTVDTQTKEILVKLGQILGKDVEALN